VKPRGLSILLCCAFLCLFLPGGCGKKDDPTAPVAVAPAKVRDLVARPAGNAITLSFAIPGKNTD